MKYALSHPWKMDSLMLAYFTGLTQVSTTLTLEMSGCILLLLAQSMEKVALNLVFVAIISCLDNLVYKSTNGIEFKNFISRLS